MKAVRFSRFGDPEVLELVDLPEPHPGPGQVRIVMRAAGLSTSDWMKRQGLMADSIEQESRSHGGGSQIASCHQKMSPFSRPRRSIRMPNKPSTSKGFSAAERAAMKERAAELRADGRKGAKKADGLDAVLEKIAAMAPADRALAERVHVTVTETAPTLTAKTWYGMPAYANDEDKIVVFFQDSGKFNYRYSTVGFQDSANLDDGPLWPVSFALTEWTPTAEKQLVTLIRQAVS